MATTQQPAPATTTQWRLDPTHSNVEFAVKHMMITTVRGRFNEVDGTVQYDEKDPTHSSLEVSIKTASLDTRTPDRDAHLRSPDFFDVEKYPTMTFRSTRVEVTGSKRLRIEGDLTIRGVTKPVVLEVVEEGRAKDPWGGDRAGFTATTTIDRNDFGLVWNKALEHGGWLVGQEVKVSLDIQLVRQA
jgi:polyisoprenoid-binding protein YceI